MKNKLLKLSEACQVLNCHKNTLRAWADEGRIPCVRFGKRGDRRFYERDVFKLIKEPRNHPTVKCPTCGNEQTTPEKATFVKQIGECHLCDHVRAEQLEEPDQEEQDED